MKILTSSLLCLTLILIYFSPAIPVSAKTLSYDATNSNESETGKEIDIEGYEKQPVLFIENKGQLDDEVKYYVKAAGQTLYLTDNSVVFDLYRCAKAEGPGSIRRKTDRLVFNLNFIGANKSPVITGLDRDTAIVNYFTGHDLDEWHTDIPTYREVVYTGIYPGIDLRLYSINGEIKYDFTVQPGADVADIRFAYDGVDGLAVKAEELIVSTVFGEVRQSKPCIYQQIGEKPEKVEGGFRLLGYNSYGFYIDRYDKSLPLIIDPSLTYSTFFGGGADDYGTSIAVDSSGCAYVTGSIRSSDFPTSTGVYDTSYNGDTDVFVAKFNPSLTGAASLVYCTFLGGDGHDYGSGIAVDASGCAYITGDSSNGTFPVTSGAYDTTFNGGRDIFIAKLNHSGTDLLYSTFLGGSSGEYGGNIAIDGSNNVYVMGHTQSGDLPTTLNAFDRTHNGNSDIFVAKLQLNGANAADLLYSTYLGGSKSEWEGDIAVDASSCAYITGRIDSSDFPTTTDAYDTSYNGNDDVFIAKLNPSLQGSSSLVYSTYLGGSTNEQPSGIAVDASGCAYVVGMTNSSDNITFPTTSGAFDTTYNGNSDAFFTKLNPSLEGADGLMYSTFIGGNGTDSAYGGLTVDSSGCAYIAGNTYTGDNITFPVTPGAFDTSGNGWWDVFVIKLWPAGAGADDLLYSTYLGGSNDETVRDIAIDASCNVYVVGDTSSADFPTQNPYQGTHANQGNEFRDVFVTKLAVEIDVDPLSLDFGSVMVGSTGNPETIIVTNNSNDNVPVGTVIMSGANTDQFSISGDDCTGQTLCPGGMATIDVVFNPTSVGDKTATLSIPFDNPSRATIEVTLSGTTPPPAPTLSYPADGFCVEGSSVTYQWNASAGADRYWIEVNTDPAWGAGTRKICCGVGDVTQYIDTGYPGNGTAYYWRVWAGNDAGWSSAGEASANSRSFSNGTSIPSAPTLTSPGDGATVSGSSVTYQWGASAGADKYWIEVNTDPAWGAGTRKICCGVGDVTQYIDTGYPDDGTAYYWRVWAGNAAGWCSAGEASANSRSFTNGIALPPAPVLTSPDDGGTVSGSSVTYQWNASAGADKYWIEVNTDPAWGAGTRKICIGVGDVTQYIDSGYPDDGTAYYWRVWAGNDAGWCFAGEASANSRSFTNGTP